MEPMEKFVEKEVEEIVDEKSPKPIRNWVLGALIFVILVFFVSKDMDRIRNFIATSGWIGLLVSVGMYALLGASPIPSEPLTILLSTIFGPLSATLVAGLGNLLAAVMEYYLGVKLGDVADFKTRKEKLPFGLGKMPIDSPMFLILARMMPGYGPKLVSVASGVYRVPIWRYLWTAAIPTFVGAAIFAYGGFGLFSLRGK
jgi:uncharacterized membrane protein YdjX (TVP38/TMEM64 family)